ncbi:hypothetical protein GcC1_206044 [Golovinomyces cichoracearum]|uniref:Uncharacterized protein n=1 Tax=Golovinomyces cichoracearum TaxID=62708 RepID=A0A420HC64_9PEZI|nr:hypothetical protein GcC1_206044 [Golovinomyces cichoracearum]
MAVCNYHSLIEETPSTYIAESYLGIDQEDLEVNFTNYKIRYNHRSHGGFRGGYRHKMLLNTGKGLSYDDKNNDNNKQGLFNFGYNFCVHG